MKALVLTSLAAVAAPSGAIPISNGSFEQGLIGWTTFGDASVHTAAFGAQPTLGEHYALITTLDNRIVNDNRDELPVSGTPAIEMDPFGFFDPNLPAIFGGGYSFSAITQTIDLRAGNVLSFDWNYLTHDTGWSDPVAVFVAPTGSHIGSLDFLISFSAVNNPLMHPASFDLYSYYLCGSTCLSHTPRETGWNTFSYLSTADGTYDFWVAIHENSDFWGPSALLVDNFKVNVPEPNTLALFGLGLVGLGLACRRRRVLPARF